MHFITSFYLYSINIWNNITMNYKSSMFYVFSIGCTKVKRRMKTSSRESRQPWLLFLGHWCPFLLNFRSLISIRSMFVKDFCFNKIRMRILQSNYAQLLDVEHMKIINIDFCCKWIKNIFYSLKKITIFETILLKLRMNIINKTTFSQQKSLEPAPTTSNFTF